MTGEGGLPNEEDGQALACAALARCYVALDDHETAVQYLLRLVGMMNVMAKATPGLMVDTCEQLAGIYAKQVCWAPRRGSVPKRSSLIR